MPRKFNMWECIFFLGLLKSFMYKINMVWEWKCREFWDRCVTTLWNSHLGMPNKQLLLILNICIFNNKSSWCGPPSVPGSSFSWVRTGCSLKCILSHSASLRAGNSSPLWLVLADFPLKLDPFSRDQRSKMRNEKLSQWNFSHCRLNCVSSLIVTPGQPAAACGGACWCFHPYIPIPLAQFAPWTLLLGGG